VGQRHGHHGKGVQKVDAIGHISKGLRVHLLLGIADVLQDVLAVGAHKDGRRADDPGQPNEVVMAAGQSIE